MVILYNYRCCEYQKNSSLLGNWDAEVELFFPDILRLKKQEFIRQTNRLRTDKLRFAVFFNCFKKKSWWRVSENIPKTEKIIFFKWKCKQYNPLCYLVYVKCRQDTFHVLILTFHLNIILLWLYPIFILWQPCSVKFTSHWTWPCIYNPVHIHHYYFLTMFWIIF